MRRPPAKAPTPISAGGQGCAVCGRRRPAGGSRRPPVGTADPSADMAAAALGIGSNADGACVAGLGRGAGQRQGRHTQQPVDGGAEIGRRPGPLRHHGGELGTHAAGRIGRYQRVGLGRLFRGRGHSLVEALLDLVPAEKLDATAGSTPCWISFLAGTGTAELGSVAAVSIREASSSAGLVGGIDDPGGQGTVPGVDRGPVASRLGVDFGHRADDQGRASRRRGWYQDDPASAPPRCGAAAPPSVPGHPVDDSARPSAPGPGCDRPASRPGPPDADGRSPGQEGLSASGRARPPCRLSTPSWP